jgi:predicted nuclease of restriction endonuclease-like (RecB) superfamily
MAKRKPTPPARRQTGAQDPVRLPMPQGYDAFLKDLKERIRTAQLKAALAVNRDLVLLYWQIGQDILAQQQQHGWGAKVIDRLAADLHHAFPDVRGFSPRNLKYMRAFALAWPDQAIVQQLVAQIPWGHNVRLLDAVKTAEAREWYARQVIENGWSRTILEMQIEAGLYRRQGKAVTNFQRTLPSPDSDLAHQVLKDPYHFDFLTLGRDAHERELQRGLLAHIRQFLLELGAGFAFVGENVHLEVGDSDFYIDLLFYHLRLRAYIVIDLKMAAFQPEFAGKINFYLSAVDDLLRHPDDKPSIGLILCKTKDQAVAEYALRDITKPVGVSGFVTQLIESLPENLQGSLPSVAELEAELQTVEDAEEKKKPPPRPRRRSS